jgi:phosphopantetheine adenylyltransferase
MLKLALASASDVRIEVLNTLGQTVQNIHAGKVTLLNQAVELGSLAQGSYFLRVTVDGETAIRRVVLQH